MSTDKKFKILVIEDNQQMSEMVSDYLSGKFPDSEIAVFSTGESALAATKSAPDVVILDYYLDVENPKALNGLQILMKIKQLYKSPVVFLTGQEKPEISANIIKYGAYDYVVKNQQSFYKLEAIINKIKSQEPEKKSGNTQNLLIALAVVLVLAIVAMFLLKGN